MGAARSFALAVPSKLNGNTTNWAGNGATGHTHEIDKATPTLAGVVKLVNTLGSAAADAALSAAMGKKLQDEKLPAGALKFSRPQVLSGNLAVELDLTSRRSIIDAFGSNYIPNGFMQMVLHNTSSNHNISGLPLRGKVYIQLDFYLMGGYSFIDCHYPGLRRSFRTKVNWNDETLTLDWKENLTEENGVMLTTDQQIDGAKTFKQLLTAGRGEHWGKLRFPVKAANAHWVLEANPDAALANRESLTFNIKFEQNGQSRYIRFPYLGAESQNVAYESWVTSYIGGYVGSYVQKSDAVNLDDGSKLATARAVKIVNDKAERAAPSGVIAYFGGQNAPAGWLKANGAAVSRTAYAALFAAIGTTYGAGDGRTTFNLPDLRGEFVRGWDDGRNIDRGRALGSRQDDAFQGHARNLKRSESNARMHGINYMQNVNVNNSPLSPAPAAVNTGDNWLTEDYLPHRSYGTPRVAAETRPRNIALLACIKI